MRAIWNICNQFKKSWKCYEWTNLNDDWRIPLLIVSNWLAQFAIWSPSCWIWVAKDEFECWYFTAIAFWAKLIARNVKLIGDSLNLTGKPILYIFNHQLIYYIAGRCSVHYPNTNFHFPSNWRFRFHVTKYEYFVSTIE